MTATGMTATATTADARRRAATAACLLAATLLAVGGCAGQPARSEGNAPTPRAPRQASAARGGNSLATDACATRLQDLGGALLLYYAVNRRLPDKVEDLSTVPGAESAQLACPVSDRPYVYVPGGGLRAQGKPRQLVLYDATPAHGGLRWGLFISPPSGSEPLATWVTPMSEALFRSYAAGEGR